MNTFSCFLLPVPSASPKVDFFLEARGRINALNESSPGWLSGRPKLSFLMALLRLVFSASQGSMKLWDPEEEGTFQ